MRELAKFLVSAKQSTYASQGEGGERLNVVSGGREFLHCEDDWQYQDVYWGTSPFCGRELVRHRSHLVWAMTYYGAVIDTNASPSEVYRFLKSALIRVKEDRPFRGPESFSEGEWSYTNTSTGTWERFNGEETIFSSGRRVYSLHYSGGIMHGDGL